MDFVRVVLDRCIAKSKAFIMTWANLLLLDRTSGFTERVQSAKISKWSGNKKYQNGKLISNGLTASTLTTDSYVRVKRPDYRQLVAKKVDASNPYSMVNTSYKQELMYSAAEYRKSGFVIPVSAITGAGVCSPPIAIPSNANTIAADDIALKRLKKKLANQQDQFNSLVPIGELKETYGLYGQVYDATTSLLKGLLDLKRRKPANLVSAASKAWLTFSFGISPTISDLNGLIGSIQSYRDRMDTVSRVKGRATTMWLGSNGFRNSVDACEGFVWDSSLSQEEHIYQVQYTAGVRMNLKSSNSYDIPEHFGLNIENLIPTLWELTVFSWVGDYFTTMGDYLEDLWYSDAGNTIYCCKSVKYKFDAEAQWSLRRILPDYYRISDSGLSIEQLSQYRFARTVLAALPHRAFRFKTAAEIGVNSVNRILNLGSLLLAK